MKDLKDRIQSRYNYYEERYAPFLSRAEEDKRFYRGEQWSEEEKKKLGKAGRPALTKNRIKPKVNMLKGYQSKTRFLFKVTANDDAPIEYDEVCRRINSELAKIENENDAEYELSDCFAEGAMIGRSFIEAYIDVDETKIPSRKQIMYKHVLASNCFPDPDSEQYDFSDAADFFKVADYSLDSLKIMFPDKIKIIDKLMPEEDWRRKTKEDGIEHRDYPTQKGSESLVDTKQGKPYVLKEYYYWEMKSEKKLVTNKSYDMNTIDIEKMDDVIAANMMKQQEDQSYLFKIITVATKVWYVVKYVSGEILDKEMLNIDEIPVAGYFPDRLKGVQEIEMRDIGVVKDLKDPQMEYNKLSSTTLAHMISTVNSGIWAEEGALKNPEDIRKYGSAPGFIGFIKKGMWEKWKKEYPASMPTGMFSLAKDAANDMDEVSNVRPDLMGVTEERKSGRAIALTQQQGFMGINHFFDQFRRTKHLLCRKLVKLMCYLYDWDYSKLRIVIDDATENPTARFTNFIEAKELFESGALDSHYGDIIVESMSLTNREQYIKRWNEVSQYAQMKQQQQQQQEAEQARQLAEQDLRNEGRI